MASASWNESSFKCRDTSIPESVEIDLVCAKEDLSQVWWFGHLPGFEMAFLFHKILLKVAFAQQLKGVLILIWFCSNFVLSFVQTEDASSQLEAVL